MIKIVHILVLLDKQAKTALSRISHSAHESLYFKFTRELIPSAVSVSLQNVFLTQQGLTQELTLDLLEKFRNPEKLKANLVTEDEEMEVDLVLTLVWLIII